MSLERRVNMGYIAQARRIYRQTLAAALLTQPPEHKRILLLAVRIVPKERSPFPKVLLSESRHACVSMRDAATMLCDLHSKTLDALRDKRMGKDICKVLTAPSKAFLAALHATECFWKLQSAHEHLATLWLLRNQ